MHGNGLQVTVNSLQRQDYGGERNKNFKKEFKIGIFLLKEKVIFDPFLAKVRYLPYFLKKRVKNDLFFKQKMLFFNLENFFILNGIRRGLYRFLINICLMNKIKLILLGW